MGRLGIEDHFPEKSRTAADATTNIMKKIRSFFIGEFEGETVTIPEVIVAFQIPTVLLVPAIARFVEEGTISGPHPAQEGKEYWVGQFAVRIQEGEAVHTSDPRLHSPKKVPWEIYWAGRNCFRWDRKKDLKAMQKFATEKYKKDVAVVGWNKRYYELLTQQAGPVRWQCRQCTNMNSVPELIPGVGYKCQTGCGEMQIHAPDSCLRCGLRGSPHRRHIVEERRACIARIMENVHNW